MAYTPGDGGAWPGELPAQLSARRYRSFVVRILVKDQDGEIDHGQVTDVASKRTLRFTDPSAVIAFILSQVKRPPSTDVAGDLAPRVD